MTILGDLKTIVGNLDKVFLNYSDYSFILIGLFIIIKYLPRLFGLTTDIAKRGVTKLFGKSAKVAPIIEEIVEQLGVDEESSPAIIREVGRLANELIDIDDDVVEEIDYDDDISSAPSRDILPKRRGRPSTAWKKVQKMIKEGRLKRQVRSLKQEDEEKADEEEPVAKIKQLTHKTESQWKKIQKMVKEDKIKRRKKGILEDVLDESKWAEKELQEPKQKKGLLESILDETKWADEIEQGGGAPSYKRNIDFGYLIVVVMGIHYLDHSKACGYKLTNKLLISGLWTVITTILIFYLITKIGLFGRLHYNLEQSKFEVIADLIDGTIVFIIYNIIRNIRNVTKANTCGSLDIPQDEQIVEVETYIKNLKVDIELLMKQIATERKEREDYQTELEEKLTEKDRITEEYRAKIDEQVSELSDQYADIDDRVEALEQELEEKTTELDTKIATLETQITDLITSQAEIQALTISRIDDVELAQEEFKNLILGRISNVESRMDELEEKMNSYPSVEEISTMEQRLAILEIEQNEILSKVTQNAESISQNTLLIETLDSEYSSLQSRVLDFEARLAELESITHHVHEEETSDNVTICHKGSTMTIASSAVDGHIGHGDTLGDC